MEGEIIPVIDCINHNIIRTNIKIVKALGIQKVFLINHRISPEELIQVTISIKGEFPSMWIGINPLGMTPERALLGDYPLDGIWTDSLPNSLDSRRFRGTHFGGLAFKYQPQPQDLRLETLRAIGLCDVPTTSGVATGRAPSLEKIMEIRGYLGDSPLAIASGVSPSNIGDWKGIANYLLVRSSITGPGGIISGEKLDELLGGLKN
jgi:hypothetical protein